MRARSGVDRQVDNTASYAGLGTFRSGFERSYGTDFGEVRIVRDRSADAVRSVAFTNGLNIHLGSQVPPLGDPRSRRLLAHELAHVVQQRAGGRGRPVDGSSSNEKRADEAEVTASDGGRVGHLGAAAPNVSQHKKPAPAGGAILYVGMNNFKPEVAVIDQRYTNVDVAISKVTASGVEAAFPSGTSTIDLTTDAGCIAFCATLPAVPAKQPTIAAECTKLLLASISTARDDLASLMQVYAQTEFDGIDRLSRVVLSGHSGGIRIFSGDTKDEIYYDVLVSLAAVFPSAAAQTKHLIVLACHTGEESIINNTFRKAFPNLVTAWGWTDSCPTGWGAANSLSTWLEKTDKAPKAIGRPPAGQASWTSGIYEDSNQVDDKSLLAAINSAKPRFAAYLAGDNVDPDNHAGPLFDFYSRTRRAQFRSTITGTDHIEVSQFAEQSFRLRFWKGQIAGFWRKNGSVLAAEGIGDMSSMTRKQAIATADAYLLAKPTGPAVALLIGMKMLDPLTMDDHWLEP
jgi:hypothetical protein